MRKIWHNGVIKDESEAVVSIYDSAMMFGDTCFEMMRTFNKKTFKLSEHIERLNNSCKMLEISLSETSPFPYTCGGVKMTASCTVNLIPQIEAVHEELLQYHIDTFPEVEEWRSLINVSRGILPLYQHMLGDSGKPNIMIAVFPLSEILKGKSWVYDGVHAIVPSQRAIPHHLLDARLKTRSRQHYMMANLEVARQDKDAWPLLLDPDGFVTESTGSNFFIVKNEKIITPFGANCLRGISREFILKGFPIIRQKDSLVVRQVIPYSTERELTIYDVMTADEAFFTCTPYSIVPCTSINGHAIGDGKVGPVTKQLIKSWSEAVGCDFVAQAKRWDAQ